MIPTEWPKSAASLAVSFGAIVFFDEVAERAAADPRDAQNIVLALNESHRKAVDGEDVLAFERVSVVAAEHILIPKRIRKDRGKRVSCFGFGDALDALQKQPQGQELPLVEHLAVALVAPPVQPLCLIAVRDLPVREFELAVQCEARPGEFQPSEILFIRRLEESAFVRGAAPLAVVLHRKQAVPGWTVMAEFGRIAALVRA